MAVGEVYAAGISDDVSSRKADNTIPLHHTLFSLFSLFLWEGTHTHIAASGCTAGKRNNQVKKNFHVFFAFFYIYLTEIRYVGSPAIGGD